MLQAAAEGGVRILAATALLAACIAAACLGPPALAAGGGGDGGRVGDADPEPFDELLEMHAPGGADVGVGGVGSREHARLLAKLIFRVLAFDRELRRRCEFEAVRLVIVRGGGERSRHEAASLARALEELRGLTIGGLPYEYQITDSVPSQEHYEVLYLPSGLSAEQLRVAAAICQERDILFLTSDVGYLQRGAAVAILVTPDKPEIVIQRSRAMEQGVRFDPRLFLYSTVLGD